MKKSSTLTQNKGKMINMKIKLKLIVVTNLNHFLPKNEERKIDAAFSEVVVKSGELFHPQKILLYPNLRPGLIIVLTNY